MMVAEKSGSDTGHFVVRALRGSGVCDCGTGEPTRFTPCGGEYPPGFGGRGWLEA